MSCAIFSTPLSAVISVKAAGGKAGAGAAGAEMAAEPAAQRLPAAKMTVKIMAALILFLSWHLLTKCGSEYTCLMVLP